MTHFLAVSIIFYLVLEPSFFKYAMWLQHGIIFHIKKESLCNQYLAEKVWILGLCRISSGLISLHCYIIKSFLGVISFLFLPSSHHFFTMQPLKPIVTSHLTYPKNPTLFRKLKSCRIFEPPIGSMGRLITYCSVCSHIS